MTQVETGGMSLTKGILWLSQWAECALEVECCEDKCLFSSSVNTRLPRGSSQFWVHSGVTQRPGGWSGSFAQRPGGWSGSFAQRPGGWSGSFAQRPGGWSGSSTRWEGFHLFVSEPVFCLPNPGLPQTGPEKLNQALGIHCSSEWCLLPHTLQA